MRRALQDYLKLPYRMELSFDPESDTWVIRYPELPGCIADGNTPAEAISEGEEAKALWLESAVEEKQEIPEPRGDSDYSGKLVLRLPKVLHETAAKCAAFENVSLNTFLIQLISEGVERSGMKSLMNFVFGQVQKTLTRVVVTHGPGPMKLSLQLDLARIYGQDGEPSRSLDEVAQLPSEKPETENGERH
jgi:antitoxin HicB